MHWELRIINDSRDSSLFPCESHFLVVVRSFYCEFKRFFRNRRILALHFPFLFILLLLIPTLLSIREFEISVVADEIPVLFYGFEIILGLRLYWEIRFERILRLSKPRKEKEFIIHVREFVSGFFIE